MKEKVQDGVAALRASMEQEQKMRQELLAQKNELSEVLRYPYLRISSCRCSKAMARYSKAVAWCFQDIAELKQLLEQMNSQLEDDVGVHEAEV